MYSDAFPVAAAVDVIGAVFVTTVFAYPSIFVHELGHVIAAKLVGLRPTHLVVGESEVLFRRAIAGVELVVCLVPFRGLAIVAHEPTDRFQTAVFALAGPATNVGVAILLLMVWPVFGHHFTLTALTLMQLEIAFRNLLPQDWEFEGRKVPSDGKRVFSCFR